jgi:ribosomal-protein-alanine N-acetyltransferase
MNDELSFSPLPKLETKRLILRKIEQADIEVIFRYTNNPVFFQTMGRPVPFSVEDTRKWVEGFLEKAGIWGVVLKTENKLIGDCGFCQYHEKANRAEISYAMDQAYWNHGYATEAAIRVIRFGFEEMRLNRIQGLCNKLNVISERVLQKAGMKYEGLLRHYIHHEGIPLDMKMYSILKQEWLERQNNS